MTKRKRKAPLTEISATKPLGVDSIKLMHLDVWFLPPSEGDQEVDVRVNGGINKGLFKACVGGLNNFESGLEAAIISAFRKFAEEAKNHD